MRVMRQALALSCLCLLGASAPAGALPPGFSKSTAFSDLPSPTAVAFSPDGRVFVGEKAGGIKVFDGLGDTIPTQFADLRAEVHNFWDRGLLALTLDPEFPAQPYVYISYTYDAPIGGTAPVWGEPETIGDGCSTPPGPTADGCVVSSRLSRLTADGDRMVPGSEKVLINDWCQQFPSHSAGDIAFGADGMLYMTGGDGASFNYADYGQTGNPCGDPPGGQLTVPTAEGGALRAQDYRTAGDPYGLNGSLIRVDPSTGLPDPVPPGATTQSALNQARIKAFGLRNPFRIAIRPDTNEVWIGDVGWNATEEINRVTGSVPNFGWPCYEGTARRYDFGLNLCDSLFSGGGATSPYFSYEDGVKIDPAESCPTDLGTALAGLTFYAGAGLTQPYPPSYEGALFFADHSRGCIWVMKAGANGLPDPATVELFDQADAGPVDLELGPDGALYYPMLTNGRIGRIAYEPDNRAPTARATASPERGAAPLTVRLDATGSTDPDAGDELDFAWDLDEDGAFDDATGATVDHVYQDPGSYRPSVRVSDSWEAFSMDDASVEVGSPPVPTIGAPQPGATFRANETFAFSGSASDAQDGTLPASSLDWSTVLNHCTGGGGCHEHPLQDFEGTAGGELTLPAHDRPYHLTLTLTATDSDGLQRSSSVDVHPKPNAAPAAQILMPAAAAGFAAGEEIAFSGLATDAEDGVLPDSALSWRLRGSDCPDRDCAAELTPPDGGGSGLFAAPSEPLAGARTLELTATDSEGEATETTLRIQPRLATLTVRSRFDGARASVARRPGRTPFSVAVLGGSAVRIAAPARQHLRGLGRRGKLRWRRWSDGGDRVHTVNPTEDARYRVGFKVQKPRRR